jgi:hypothetical protein
LPLSRLVSKPLLLAYCLCNVLTVIFAGHLVCTVLWRRFTAHIDGGIWHGRVHSS